MSKDVNKLLTGARDVVLAAVDQAGNANPAGVGDTFPLLHLDYVDEQSIQSDEKKVSITEGGGNVLQAGSIASVNVKSLCGAGAAVQSAQKFKNANCNIYGFGAWQSHKLTNFLMNLETPIEGKKGGKELLAFSSEKMIRPDETLGNLGQAADAYAADVAYRLNNIVKNIRQENLVFAVYPYLGNFAQAAKLYDASDNRFLGTLYNGPIWNAAPLAGYNVLTFDGVNDYADFGDILNGDGLSDRIIEVWVTIKGADGTNIIVLEKIQNLATGNPGFFINRQPDNKLYFCLNDSATSAGVGLGAPVLQGTTVHMFIAIDRDTKTSIYFNGSTVGSSVATSGIGSDANANSLLIGKVQSIYGNFNLGALRIYNFASGNLPNDAALAAMAARHYNAEKAIFGL